ncbi:MAG: M20/M25/M40 family metallo-hydrolase [Armatimonadetes bacterium]|nr:M20/M25/M40 family metallo-hydrolase [Armatimonadota bacterium]
MRSESLEFLKAIVNVPSPSGFEEYAAEVYRQYTKAFADDIKTDVHGNVAAILNPDAEMKIMLAGHMDEIGFLIHYIGDDGLLYFSTIGGHDSAIPVGQRVWVHGKERIPGIIGRKAIHLLKDEERKKKPEIDDLWIDIGCTSKEEAEKLVSLGDPVTYQYEFQMLQGDRASARGFDNKMGSFIVAEALRMLKEEGGLHPGVGVYAVATVQEEIGLRGARTSSYWINAQSGLAVDVNHAIDYPSVSKTKYGQLDVGKGPSVMRGANANPIVFRMILDACDNADIPYQVDVTGGGTGTDGNAMQLNRAGMAVGIVGVPLRYMHTPVELLSLTDVENCAKLMAAYCRSVTPETDFTPRIVR